MRRRELLGAVGTGLVLPPLASMPVWAQAKTMNIIGHAVHQRSLTQGLGGDIQAEWAGPKGVAVEWLTFAVEVVHDRLFREASLGQGTVSVGLAVNRYASPNMANLFEPLDDYLAKAGIESFEEIAPGMRDTVTYGGKLYGIPFRHATSGLHFNEEFLAERGLSGPPRTAEELIEYARKLTYTRADGTQVHGLLFDGPRPPLVSDLARAFGGDFITTDYRCVADEPGMVEAVTLLRDFYKEGVLPKIWLNFTTEDTITFMQQGRGAMAITAFNRNVNFGDKAKSQFPGKFGTAPVPLSSKLGGPEKVAPAKTEFWVLTIPRNAPEKDLAWDFIRTVSTPENTIRSTLNGNGPVRPSAYADERVQKLVPYAKAESQALAVARPPLPGFENAAKAEDVFIEELGLVLLGRKEPEAAMAAVTARVTPLLPQRS